MTDNWIAPSILSADFAKLGVRGTPMMITETGTVFPGYVPAKQLAKALSTDK